MLTAQQRNQIFNVSIKELANPNATVPVKFDPFERFVRKAQNYSKNLYFLMLTFVFIWSVLFVSIKGFILFVVMLRSVGFCFSHADFSIRKAAKWYWYIVTKNHMKVHDKYCVPFSKDEYSCYCSVSEKNSASVFISEDEEYVSSIPSKDTYPSLDSVLDDSSRCYCSMCLEEDNAGATNENRSGVLGEKDTDGFATKKGDVIVVNFNKNIRVPKYRDSELAGDQVGDDTGLTGGEAHVETNLYDQNSKVDGNITSDILNDEVLSSHVENIVENTPRDVLLQPLVDNGKDSSSSDASFSTRNVCKQDSTVLRSLLRVRRFVRSCQSGAPKCIRPRCLRRQGKFSFRFSSNSVEYVELEGFARLKNDSSDVESGMEVEDVDFCEPMEVDSFEYNSCEFESSNDINSFEFNSVEADAFVGCENAAVVDGGSFCVGLPTLEEGSLFEPIDFDNLLSNTFIPDPQPCDQTFLEGTAFIYDQTLNGEIIDDAALLVEHLLGPTVESALVVEESAVMVEGGSDGVEELLFAPVHEEFDTLVCVEPDTRLRVEPVAVAGLEELAPADVGTNDADDEENDEAVFASILSSALANTTAMPLVEGAFNSDELLDQLHAFSAGSNIEDPFGSKPIEYETGSSSTEPSIENQEDKKKSKLDALFEESEEEEEEEEEKPTVVPFKSRYRKDDRKIIQPKSLISRRT